MFKLTSDCAGVREVREECVRWVWDEPMLSVRLRLPRACYQVGIQPLLEPAAGDETHA